MPNKHWVLVAERRGKPTSQRRREIIYVTDDKERAKQDALDFGKVQKGHRYYVMKYEQIVQVAERELAQLEQALALAEQLKVRV